MALPTSRQKIFQVTADTTGLLANDQVLGSTGKGWYKVIPKASAAADGSFTINDGKAAVYNAVAIPVKAAGVTYPPESKLDDRGFVVYYEGEGATCPIDLLDGTNAEITVVVQYGGRGASPAWPEA